jgi:hypothetical protein
MRTAKSSSFSLALSLAQAVRTCICTNLEYSTTPLVTCPAGALLIKSRKTILKMALVVSPDYGYVIAAAIATCFQYSLQAAGVAKARYSAMTREYLDKHFSAENEGKWIISS